MKEARAVELVFYVHTLSRSESLIVVAILPWMQNPCPYYDLNYNLVEHELIM